MGFFHQFLWGLVQIKIFSMLITKIIMIFAEFAYLPRSLGLKIARFRKFSHFLGVFKNFCKFRNFDARTFYSPSNERSWAPLCKKYKFISARIYRKKVRELRKLQKVRKLQKCLDRNARQIKKNVSPNSFIISNNNILGYQNYQICCCLKQLPVLERSSNSRKFTILPIS